MSTQTQWNDLSWEEKREDRFNRWLHPPVTFSSAEAENKYRQRVTRFIKAIKLQEPDRVPVMLPAGNIPPACPPIRGRPWASRTFWILSKTVTTGRFMKTTMSASA